MLTPVRAHVACKCACTQFLQRRMLRCGQLGKKTFCAVCNHAASLGILGTPAVLSQQASAAH